MKVLHRIFYFLFFRSTIFPTEHFGFKTIDTPKMNVFFKASPRENNDTDGLPIMSNV